ncbi:MAG: hypothetical protein CO125_07235 [Hydrogenophilales bacterium CG_4_9_14_3_um_filter_59_35]|nr:MAG: hypothetical protein CO125_07235 [Hydrogenophilales bacterium CG_4_9_14_3_um_filter_59_35]
MAMTNSRKQPARKRVDRMARMRGRMIETMLRKLEVNPHQRYEEILSVEEYNEAVLMIHAAVAYARGYIAAQYGGYKRSRKPQSFVWCGKRYALTYSGCDRIYITTKGGVRVIAWGYDVI